MGSLAQELKIGEQAKWRPIDKAPKDGTPILASDGSFCFVCRWDSHDKEWGIIKNEGFAYEACWGGELYVATVEPTHWMPLPDLPRYKTFDSMPIGTQEERRNAIIQGIKEIQDGIVDYEDFGVWVLRLYNNHPEDSNH